MDFNPYELLAGFIFGVIGWWMLKEGRRRGEIQIALIGLGLMIVPYFTSGLKMMLVVCGGLCLLAYNIW